MVSVLSKVLSYSRLGLVHPFPSRGPCEGPGQLSGAMELLGPNVGLGVGQGSCAGPAQAGSVLVTWKRRICSIC